jgi:hypothetical protein
MDNNKNLFLDKIDLAPLPPGISDCKLLITKFEISDPEGEDSLHVIVSYSVTNETDQDWDYFESRCQLLNAKGIIIEETQDASEVVIASGETETFNMSIWVDEPQFLENIPEKIHVTLHFSACTFLQQHIGRIKIPCTPSDVSSINHTKIGKILTLVTGKVIMEEQYDENEVFIEIKLLIQNNTLYFLPVVELIAPVKDRKDRIFKIESFSEGIPPAAITTIDGRFHANQKRLIGGELDATLKVYWPVASEITQKYGATILHDAQIDNDSN